MRKLLLAVCLLVLPGFSQAAGFEHFITVKGYELMDGDQPFRFVSFNVPTLNYQEDEMAFKVINPYALPDEYEMRDVFESVRQMGGRVIRIYTIPVKNKNFPPEAPTYVEAPGQFNEAAFQVTDQMLALANEYNVRIIFSLLNNWQWMGGRPNYAAFRGMDKDAFWTDPQLIADFKKTVEFVVNRTNTVSGIKYKDDKAILCWETGNELTSPVDWTIDITRYIKSMDKNHLILDGFHAIDDKTLVREESIKEWSIDIVHSHHYEQNAADIAKNIFRNVEIINGRKPYIVGEFGFASTTAMEDVLERIVPDKRITGALTWSLRHHRRHGGFYWHSEPLGGDIYKAYHWPGFVTGQEYDEINLLDMYRSKAFAIQGLTVPPVPAPQPPVLLPIEQAHSISWRGSAGASGYNIERATANDGPWELIGYNVSDSDVPYFPLFNDETAELGKRYYYRISALNRSGVSKPSNIVGPVAVKQLALIDTMKNIGVLYQSKQVTPVTGNDRNFKEIINRLSGNAGSEIVYRIPGKLDEFRVYAFEQKRPAHLEIHGSVDGDNWRLLEVAPELYVNAETNYGYWMPKLYSYNKDKKLKFFKLAFKDVAQIARVEVLYTR
jgi:mannan endo-1,4-beta-mannosidase